MSTISCLVYGTVGMGLGWGEGGGGGEAAETVVCLHMFVKQLFRVDKQVFLLFFVLHHLESWYQDILIVLHNNFIVSVCILLKRSAEGVYSLVLHTIIVIVLGFNHVSISETENRYMY